MRLLFFVLLFVWGSAQAGTGLCKDAEGFRWPMTHPKCEGRQEIGASPAKASSPKREIKKIDFGGDEMSRLIKAVAVLESIHIDGRDCKWDLSVTKEMLACIKFLGQLTEGAEFDQAIAQIQSLLKDEAFLKENVIRFSKAKRIAEEIMEYSQFARARLVGVK